MKRTITLSALSLATVFTLSVFAGVAGSIEALHAEASTNPRVLAAVTEEENTVDTNSSSGVANDPSKQSNTTTDQNSGNLLKHQAGTNVVANRTVYIIDNEGKKRAYPTLLSFISYPGNSLNNVPDAHPGDLTLPNGPIVEVNSGVVVADGATVYLIKDGQKHGFTTYFVFTDLGYSLDLIIKANTFGIPEGEVIRSSTQQTYKNSGVIKTTPLGGESRYGKYSPISGDSEISKQPLPTSSAQPCVIDYFTASPEVVAPGQEMQLKWKTSNCTFVLLMDINAENLIALSKKEMPKGLSYRANDVENVLPIKPVKSAPVMLIASKVPVQYSNTGNDALTNYIADQKNLIIRVGDAGSTQACSGAALSANPTAVAYNGQSTLSYSIPAGCTGYVDSNTDATFIKNNLTGSGQFSTGPLTRGTVFVLHLQNASEFAKGPSATVAVDFKSEGGIPCVINSFTVSPETVSANAAATLNWTSSGCTSLSINGGSLYNKQVAANGNSGVFAATGYARTEFILTAQPGNVTAKTYLNTSTGTNPGTDGTNNGTNTNTSGGVTMAMGVRNVTLNHTKYLASTPAKVGDTVEFEVTFKNGNANSATIYFSNHLASGLDYVSGSNNFGPSFDTMFTKEAGILVGTNVTYKMIYRVKVTGGSGTLTNTILNTRQDSSVSADIVLDGSNPSNPTNPTNPSNPNNPNPVEPQLPPGSNAGSTTTVNGVDGAPSITLSIDKKYAQAGEYVNLTWSAQGADFCISAIGQRDFPYFDGWSGGLLENYSARRATSGSMLVGPVYPGSEIGESQSSYVMLCQSAAGKTNAAVVYLQFMPGPVPKVNAPDGTLQAVGQGSDAAKNAKVPQLTISANSSTVKAGSQLTLNWNATNVTACFASGGQTNDTWAPGSGPTAKSSSSSQNVTPSNVSARTTYILTCYGQYGQTVVKSVSVQVTQ